MEKTLAYKPQSAWETYADAKQRKSMEALAARYIDFLTRCKTERETVDYVRERLSQAGYSEDFSKERVLRPLRGKALFAARRGSEPLEEGLALIAAHADTPRLDFKQRPLIEQPGVAQAKTHYYGGIRKYQWLARPLALHGVVIRENGESLAMSIGEKPGEPVFCIADLLPHLAQKQSSQTISEAFEAEKLNIILAHSPKTVKKGKDKDAPKEPVKEQLLEILHKKYGINEEDLITAELQAVPAGPARFVGFDKALVGGYGQDDRICVFTRTAPRARPRAFSSTAWKTWPGPGLRARPSRTCCCTAGPFPPTCRPLWTRIFRKFTKSRTRPSWATAPASPSSRVRAANTGPARLTPNFSANCAACIMPKAFPGRPPNWARWIWAAAAQWPSSWRPTACGSSTWARPCSPCTVPLNWPVARISTPRWKPTGPFWKPESFSDQTLNRAPAA